jgi:hypothetical protein
MNWAFKSTIDMLFEMMILTNPFDIARVYWNVLQDATSNLQKVASEEGTEKTVEIAMDELFPALLVCVFVFGVDEWMDIALYTVSFNQHVADDSQLHFSMTCLEALMAHVEGLDLEGLKRAAEEMKQTRIVERA